MFVVVVNISNINYSNNVSYNLFLLPGTKKADETKVHPEFSRYNVCISKFCFHFLKEVMCFSNIAIWQSGHKNNWTQWPLAISPNLIYSSFSSCVPTNDVLVPSPLFSPKLSVKKKKKKDSTTASQSSVTSPYKTPFNVSFPLCSKLYLGALLDYYTFKYKYLMIWK